MWHDPKLPVAIVDATRESQTVRDDHVEMLLDLALEATFPASDALALPLGADRAGTKSA